MPLPMALVVAAFCLHQVKHLQQTMEFHLFYDFAGRPFTSSLLLVLFCFRDSFYYVSAATGFALQVALVKLWTPASLRLQEIIGLVSDKYLRPKFPRSNARHAEAPAREVASLCESRATTDENEMWP